MKFFYVFLLNLLTVSTFSQSFQLLSSDPEDDNTQLVLVGNHSPDLRSVYYRYDTLNETVSFRVETFDDIPYTTFNWGIYILIDSDENPLTGSSAVPNTIPDLVSGGYPNPNHSILLDRSIYVSGDVNDGDSATLDLMNGLVGTAGKMTVATVKRPKSIQFTFPLDSIDDNSDGVINFIVASSAQLFSSDADYMPDTGFVTTPAINCVSSSPPTPNVATLDDVVDGCSVTLNVPFASDECFNTIIGTTTATFPITAIGTTVVTWTYDDGNGNTSTQNQNVIISPTPPVPDNSVLEGLIGECSVTSFVSTPTATDRCGNEITGTTTTVLPITTIGTTVITWTYDDGNGNVSTQDQDVVVLEVDASTSLSGLTITANNSSATSYQWVDCDNGNSTISGETGQSFTASTNGNYAVVVTKDSCSKTSDCVSITGVGIDENSFQNEIKEYPNPTAGNFSIDLKQTYPSVTITLIDICGKTLSEKNYKQSRILSFDITEKPSGIYFVKVDLDEESRMIKLIKK